MTSPIGTEASDLAAHTIGLRGQRQLGRDGNGRVAPCGPLPALLPPEGCEGCCLRCDGHQKGRAASSALPVGVAPFVWGPWQWGESLEGGAWYTVCMRSCLNPFLGLI